MEKFKNIIQLNIAFLIYSISSVLSKKAVMGAFFSRSFILYYAGSLLLMFVYMILWQQILKKVPLTIAYTNKSVIIIWGMLWGSIIFHETIRINMIFGAMIIIFGLYLIGAKNED